MIFKVNGKDLTDKVGNITLNSDINALGDKLEFEVPYKLSNYPYQTTRVNIGDTVQVFENGENIFLGIVISKTENENIHRFICFDYAFYLNKSKTLRQFNKVLACDAIKHLLNDFNVPYGHISNISVVIDNIYYDKTVADIIDDILGTATKNTGQRYIREMNGGKFEIFHEAEKVISYTAKLAENIYKNGIEDLISNPIKMSSMEDMKNSIKIYTQNDSKMLVHAEAKNDEAIGKYGLLSETQAIERDNLANAQNVANTLLQELCKISFSGNIDVIGDFRLRAGRILHINAPEMGFNGKYKITSANHNIRNIHITNLQLSEVDI